MQISVVQCGGGGKAAILPNRNTVVKPLDHPMNLIDVHRAAY